MKGKIDAVLVKQRLEGLLQVLGYRDHVVRLRAAGVGGVDGAMAVEYHPRGRGSIHTFEVGLDEPATTPEK